MDSLGSLFVCQWPKEAPPCPCHCYTLSVQFIAKPFSLLKAPSPSLISNRQSKKEVLANNNFKAFEGPKKQNTFILANLKFNLAKRQATEMDDKVERKHRSSANPSKHHATILIGSFEEMTVSPTPGSPLHAESSLSPPQAQAPDNESLSRPTPGGEPMPTSKISLSTEICYKGQWTKKTVRILPSASIHVFLDKLDRKKFLPTTAMLGGMPLKSEQLRIFYGKAKEDLNVVDMERWSEPVWTIGMKDKDFIIIEIEDLKALSTMPTSTLRPEVSYNIKSGAEESKDLRRSIIERFVRRGSAPIPQRTSSGTLEPPNRGRLFGVHIDMVAAKGEPLMSSYGVPAFFDEIINLIKSTCTPVSRCCAVRSGSLTACKELKKKIDLGQVPPFDDDIDVHVLTGMIKQYLRELPEPLLAYTLFESWKSAVNCELKEKKLELIKAVILALPKANYCLLKRLMEFLDYIAAHETNNKMGLVNLATLMGPNLIWSPERDAGGLNDISTPTQVCYYLLTHIKVLFPEPEERASILLAIGKAKYDFVPEEANELPARAGEVIFVTGNDLGSGWMDATTARNVMQGKFPSNYFELITAFPTFDTETVLSISQPGSPVLFRDEDRRGLIILRDETHRAIEEINQALERNAEKLDALETDLRSRLEDDEDRKITIEENLAKVYDNFNILLQVVIKMKGRQKNMRARLAELFPSDPAFVDDEE